MKKFYLLFLLMLVPLVASADAVEINGIYYNLNAENQTAQVTSKASKYSGDIVIPESVTYDEATYNVISIGASAFSYGSGLTSITIPNSVTSIENGAFRDCSGLTSLTIPNSVTYIGYYVFSGCSGLTSIVVEAGNTVYDSRDNCNAIIKTENNTLIRGCETTIFPSSVTSIGRYAFEGCTGLTSVTIPPSVTSIEDCAFTYCNNLTSIVVDAGNTVFDSRDNCNAIIRTKSNSLIAGCKTTVIPYGVVTIASNAFAGHSGLTSVDIPNSVTSINGSAFHMCSGLASVSIPNSVTYIGGNAFYNCSSLTSVIIPNSVTTLDNVFNGCSGLTSVEIPNSVTTIGDYCFVGCRSLTSVEIPNSVTTIGQSAFSGCNGLTSVEIPNSVTSIGESAFRNCKGLTKVTSLATTPPQADEKAFTKFDIPLYVPKGTRDAYLAASPWNKFKEIIEIGNTGEDDITNDKTKRTIHVETAGTLPDLISKDEKYQIEELTLTGNLNGTDIFLIRDMAGVNMDNMETEYAPGYGAKTKGILKVLDLSDANIVEGGRNYYTMMTSSSENSFGYAKYTQANTISDCMFAGCWKLEELILPKSVTSISSPCADLYAWIPIPMNIKKLKVADGNPNYISPDDCNAVIEKETRKLIAGCATTVIPEDVTSIGDNAFRDNQGLTSIAIPSSVTSIGSYAFDGCSGLTTVKISNGVTSIGYCAFDGCSGLTTVDIPNSVTSIGSGAFENCSGLTSVTIPNSITSINEFAFFGCESLTSVSIPNSVTSIGECAFRYCSGLTKVTSLATTPPSLYDNSFSNYDIPLYVPKGTRDAYLAQEPWNKFKEIIELDNTTDDTDEEVIKITAAGQTTWCSAYDLDFTGIDGLKAYTATGYNRTTGTIWLTRINEVPAKMGILLIGNEGEYKVPKKSTTCYYANWLVGTLEATTIQETNGDYTNYYLSSGDYGVGFYKVNGSVGIKANRAYLPLLKGTTQAGTRFIGIEYGDGAEGTTGISATLNDEGEMMNDKDVYYNLQGQRVENPSKGLYIRNGKKVMIK